MNESLRFWLPPLQCANKIEGCRRRSQIMSPIKRFHFCCLYCRWRRKAFSNWNPPSWWIKYTYRAILPKIKVLGFLERDGKRFRVEDHIFTHVWIDPRGMFTSARCAAIMVLDYLMLWFHVRKPLIEFCELLANYP